MPLHSNRHTLHVIYVGPVDFPSSSANAQRMAGVIEALRAAGDRVSVGSGGWGTDSVVSGIADVGVSKLAELPDPQWHKIRRVWSGLSRGAATRSWIQDMETLPDVILVYGTSLGYLLRLIPLARRLHIPIVIDAVEWYQSSHLPGGRVGPFAIANFLSMRFVATRADGVIAISRYLARHFQERGVATLRVPPLFTISTKPRKFGVAERPLTLCFVGSAGRKDERTLRNLILLPSTMGLDSAQLSIHIVGLPKVTAAAQLGDEVTQAIDHECLQFHDRVSSIDARQVVANSHFSVLQRSDERYTQAGFPSKVAESLLLGSPVMGNLTSDLADFLVDGRNARVVTDSTLTALIDAVSRVLREPYGFDRELIASEAQARFSPQRHAASIHDFLVHRTTNEALLPEQPAESE